MLASSKEGMGDKMNELKRVDKYGQRVWSNVETDIMRGEQCLCLHCGQMNNFCDVAKKLYALCKKRNLALMVTRCPNWRENEKV